MALARATPEPPVESGQQALGCPDDDGAAAPGGDTGG
jgi:hypothetical protein